MNHNTVKLEQAITECKKHLLRLDYAKENMKLFMPLTNEKYENLKNNEIIYVDQFLYRFAKLQDVIGQKLIKCIYEYIGESSENKSFRDVFNKLEQIGVIEDFEKWNSLREIRNELSHEYGDDVKENVERLNLIFELEPALKEYFEKILTYYEQLR